mmetsp:Transcript_367/g.543  ORF Transcript_367/g.543 Transcript_367/m.543 type:complete len:121 (-) Transcript_367:1406-1768(-)
MAHGRQKTEVLIIRSINASTYESTHPTKSSSRGPRIQSRTRVGINTESALNYGMHRQNPVIKLKYSDSGAMGSEWSTCWWMEWVRAPKGLVVPHVQRMARGMCANTNVQRGKVENIAGME